MHTGGSPAIFPAVGWFPSTEGGISRSRAQRSQDIDRGKNTHFRTPLRFKVPSLLQNSRGADWDWPLFPWCIPFASKVHPGFQGRSKSRSEVWSGGIFRAAVSWVARARIPRDFLRDLLRSERPEYSEDQSETLLEVLPSPFEVGPPLFFSLAGTIALLQPSLPRSTIHVSPSDLAMPAVQSTQCWLLTSAVTIPHPPCRFSSQPVLHPRNMPITPRARPRPPLTWLPPEHRRLSSRGPCSPCST